MNDALTKAREELAEAKANLDRWEALWENYDGNNPNKYQSDLKAARRRHGFAASAVRRLEGS